MHSFEKLFEMGNTPIDRFEDGLQNPFGISRLINGDFVSAYLNQDIGIQLETTVSFLGSEIDTSDSHELVFTLQKVHRERMKRDHSSWPSVEHEFNLGRNGCNNMEPSVPIFSSAIVKDGKSTNEEFRLRASMFSNIVRLYILKPNRELLREWGLIDGISIESFVIGTDRKCHSILVGRGLASVFQDGCLVDQMVQSGPKLIEHLSKLKSEIIFGNRSIPNVSNDPLCPIAIHLYGGFIGFWIDNRFPYRFERFRVKHCPAETLPTLYEDGHLRL